MWVSCAGELLKGRDRQQHIQAFVIKVFSLIRHIQG
jgi:hypothetical protein